jgi:hypothetical protein
MSAVAIVAGVTEGLSLIEALIGAAANVSTQIRAAQSSGTPLNLATVQVEVATAMAAAQAAIATDPKP